MDEKLNLIPVPNEIGYSRPIPVPVLNQFSYNKKKVFLSFNGNVVMHYPTICAHFNISFMNNSVAL